MIDGAAMLNIIMMLTDRRNNFDGLVDRFVALPSRDDSPFDRMEMDRENFTITADSCLMWLRNWLRPESSREAMIELGLETIPCYICAVAEIDRRQKRIRYFTGHLCDYHGDELAQFPMCIDWQVIPPKTTGEFLLQLADVMHDD